jgi:hypothetical protein
MLLGASGESLAQPTTVPTGLNPGDQYRLAFVTSTTRNGASTNIADYNTFVAGVAATVPELVALGTTWKAVGSTPTVDARDNTGTAPTSPDDVPIYLLNDTLLASGNADLWDGTIANPFAITETGTGLGTGQPVWTGSTDQGVKHAFPLGCESSGLARLAATSSTESHWIDTMTLGCFGPDLFYAISGVLSVQGVPTPPEVPALPGWGVAVLIGSLLAISGWRVRKVV